MSSSLLLTLLIPFRKFFSGKKNSGRFRIEKKIQVKMSHFFEENSFWCEMPESAASPSECRQF
jgi:hypothetical protein